MGSDTDSKHSQARPARLILAKGFFCLSLVFIMVVPLSQSDHYVRLHGCNLPTFPRTLQSQTKGPLSSTTRVEAIAQICVGRCNFEMFCTSVRSLRVAGGWEGPIYVFTDDPETMQGHCNADYTPVQVQSDMNYVQIQDIKRKLFEMVPGNPKAILYLDTDIVALKCLSSMEALFDAFAIRVFPDNICTDCNIYNGGTILMEDKPETRQCLEDWSTELARDNYQHYSKEQPALDFILGEGKCKAIEPLPSTLHLFVSVDILAPGIVPRIQLLFNSPLFAHFTHGIRDTSKWKYVLGDLNAQLDVLERMNHDLPANAEIKRLRAFAEPAEGG